MNQKKQKISNISKLAISVFFVALCMLPAQPASAHHATDCSDVFTPLSSFVNQGVSTNRSAYEQAMNETGVPWELLAAIHYRETSFSRSNPANGMGIFQFSGGAGGPYPAGPVSDEEFYRQLKFMANKVQDDYAFRGSVPRERRRLQPNEPNAAIVKDTLFSYNGRASVYADQAVHFGFNRELQPYEGSPYVMNRFDCPRARMGIITQDYGSIDGRDTRYGAFTVYARLRGDDYWRSVSSSPFGDGYLVVKSDDTNDPRQWVLYGASKQYIPDGQTKVAWGLQNQPVTTVSAASLGVIPDGPDLTRLLQYGGHTYFVDSGRRYSMPWDSLRSAWNLTNVPAINVSRGLFELPIDSGNLTFAVRRIGDTTTYMVDGNNNGQTVLRPYASDTVRQAWEGPSSAVTVLSTDYWDVIDNAIGSQISTTKIAFGGNEYQVMQTRRYNQSVAMGVLYPGTANGVSGATFDRLVPGGTVSPLVRGISNATVYLMDGGEKHALSSLEAQLAWTPPGTTAQIMNDAFMDALPIGSAMSGYLSSAAGQLYIVDVAKMPVPSGALDTAFRAGSNVHIASLQLMAMYPTTPNQATSFMRKRSSADVYLLDSSGKRRVLDTAAKNAAWGSEASGVHVFADYIVNSFGTAASAGVYVSDGSTEFVMNNGKKLSVSSGIKADWGLSSPQIYSDGTLGRFTTQGALDNKIYIPGDGYFLIRQGAAYGSWDKYVAQAWGIQDAQTGNGEMLRLLPVRNLARFVRSSTQGDTRLFVVDAGQWYNLTSVQEANFGVTNHPVMSLPPSLAPNTITDWTALVVKNSVNSYYVIDGGGKRFIDNVSIRNAWTANGSTTVPTVSDGFLGMFPTVGLVERAIKGSGPQIYLVENNTKRPIISQQTYQQQYAPYSQVSDQLLNALPTGTSIN